jgi:hypothetical protein
MSSGGGAPPSSARNALYSASLDTTGPPCNRATSRSYCSCTLSATWSGSLYTSLACVCVCVCGWVCVCAGVCGGQGAGGAAQGGGQWGDQAWQVCNRMCSRAASLWRAWRTNAPTHTTRMARMTHAAHPVGAELGRVPVHAAYRARAEVFERAVERGQLAQLQLLVHVVLVVRGRAQLLDHRARAVHLAACSRACACACAFDCGCVVAATAGDQGRKAAHGRRATHDGVAWQSARTLQQGPLPRPKHTHTLTRTHTQPASSHPPASRP